MNGPMKSAAVYGGLLAVLLAASWVRWTSEPALELDGKVVMIAGDIDSIETVTWQAENKDKAVIQRKSDDLGAYYWVDYTRWTEVKPVTPVKLPADDEVPTDDDDPDNGEDGEDGSIADDEGDTQAVEEPPPEPTYDESRREFKAADKAEEVFQSFAPLLALRKLDDLTSEKLDATELDASTESVVLVKGGKTITIKFGGEVYGTKDRYARIEGSEDVYLIDDELLRPLKYARTRLPDRSLWPFEPKDLVTVTVSHGTGSVELSQKNAADPSKATWVRTSAPEGDEPQLQTWMDKALKLKSVAYADEEDDTEGIELLFSMTLEGAKGPPQTVEVLQKPDGQGDFFARSAHTRGLVKLLKGPTSQLVDDVAGLVEGG